MLSLKHPYLSVDDGRNRSYGGNQMRSDRAVIRKCGCGPIAALDTVWYLEHRGQTGAVSLTDYNTMLNTLCRRYFLLVPPFGINSFVLTADLNLLLHARRLPYRAVWMMSGTKLWQRVEDMLARDLPVILSVGPNFPAVWQNNRLPFYTRSSDGSLHKAAATKGHFVTATGLDEEWVRISSWGREYYINRSEYERYTRENSHFAFSNLVYLREIPENNGGLP